MNINELIQNAENVTPMSTVGRSRNVRGMTADEFRKHFASRRDAVASKDCSRADAANCRAVCGLIIGKNETQADARKRLLYGNSSGHFAFYNAIISEVTVKRDNFAKLSPSPFDDGGALASYAKNDSVRLLVMTGKTPVEKNG